MVKSSTEDASIRLPVEIMADIVTLLTNRSDLKACRLASRSIMHTAGQKLFSALEINLLDSTKSPEDYRTHLSSVGHYVRHASLHGFKYIARKNWTAYMKMSLLPEDTLANTFVFLALLQSIEIRAVDLSLLTERSWSFFDSLSTPLFDTLQLIHCHARFQDLARLGSFFSSLRHVSTIGCSLLDAPSLAMCNEIIEQYPFLAKLDSLIVSTTQWDFDEPAKLIYRWLASRQETLASLRSLVLYDDYCQLPEDCAITSASARSLKELTLLQWNTYRGAGHNFEHQSSNERTDIGALDCLDHIRLMNEGSLHTAMIQSVYNVLSSARHPSIRDITLEFLGCENTYEREDLPILDTRHWEAKYWRRLDALLVGRTFANLERLNVAFRQFQLASPRESVQGALEKQLKLWLPFAHGRIAVSVDLNDSHFVD